MKRPMLGAVPEMAVPGGLAAGFSVFDRGSLYRKTCKLPSTDADAPVSILMAALAKRVSNVNGMLESGNHTPD